MRPIPSDSPIQFLVEIQNDFGARLRVCTGPKHVGDYVPASVDLTVTEAPGNQRALSIEVAGWLMLDPPTHVHARVGMILTGETVDDVVWMYEDEAILS